MGYSQLNKRLNYLKSRWPKSETNEMKYIKYHIHRLKKLGQTTHHRLPRRLPQC
jgi:hypothetical protein